MKQLKPNVFIVGAPKSGTTALAEYLSTHPKIFVPALKEPGYFSSDFPGMCVIRDESEYLALYAKVPASKSQLCDASVTYLRSECAVQKILAFQPEARFIVMLRNPVDLIAAEHSQLLFTGIEDQELLETAWALQSERANGNAIGPGCIEPKLLQYAETASNGRHIQRLFSLAGRERVHIILFDDFAGDTRKSYLKVLSFLGLPDDGRGDFPVINENKVPRSVWLTRVIHSRGSPLSGMKPLLKRKLEGLLYRFAAAVYRLTGRKQKRGPVSPALAGRIYETMEDDVLLLERLLDRSLEQWKALPEQRASAAIDFRSYPAHR